VGPRTLWYVYFSFDLFFNKQALPCCGRAWWRISQTLGTHVRKKSYHHLLPSFRTLTNEAGKTFDSLSVNEVIVGLFEEEEEGIGIVSDVVKVEGEDPATPRAQRGKKVRWHVGDPFRVYVFCGPTLKKPRDHNDCPIWV